MQRLLSASLALVTLTLASAAAQDKAIDHAYYPLKLGKQWTYRSGKETVAIQVEREAPVEFMPVEGKSQKAVGYILKISSGPREVTEQVAVLPDGVYRFSTAGKSIKPPLCFFKFNVNAGDAWKVDSRTDDGKRIQGQLVAGSETINLALGGKQVEVKTLTVTSKDLLIEDEEMTLKYWFAEGIGLVKQRVKLGRHDQTLELRSVTQAK